MAPQAKRVALYLRVSTDGQSVDNQWLGLEAVCDQRSWEVVQVYSDMACPARRGATSDPAWMHY
jgi:DNA invertase Pin-like site-specific DNA recombinase